ncbi:MAG: CGGC domain-containing protein [Syntrophales bacterium]
MKSVKIGIIICNRYRRCAGGKCFRALREREGAFSPYKKMEASLVGFTTCDGCPGGNVEYAPEEMVRNGADVIHLATGLIVGYPPCPRIGLFRDFIQSRFGIPVVYGTHPIPQKYYLMHQELHTWDAPFWQEVIRQVMVDEDIRCAYD